LKLILPDHVDLNGSLCTWGFHALDSKHWNELIDKYRNDDGDYRAPPPPTQPSSTPPSSPPQHTQNNHSSPSPTSSPPQYRPSNSGDDVLKCLEILDLSIDVTECELKMKY